MSYDKYDTYKDIVRLRRFHNGQFYMYDDNYITMLNMKAIVQCIIQKNNYYMKYIKNIQNYELNIAPPIWKLLNDGHYCINSRPRSYRLLTSLEKLKYL